jgi:hypothetical protein
MIGEKLNKYLAESLGRPYKLGEWDCAMFVAEWVDLLAGSNRAGFFRGNYSEQLEGLRKYGPLVRRVSHELELLGFTRHELPELGDVAAMPRGMVGVITRVREVYTITMPVEGLPSGGLLSVPVSHGKEFYRWAG